MIEFFVPGIPRPQGSKRHVGGGRMIEASKHVKAWRNLVRTHAIRHQPVLLTGPVTIHLTYYFGRPKKHFKRNGELRSDAPSLPDKRPDLDKLNRAIFDSLTGVCYVDDCQICEERAVKFYIDPDTDAGVVIYVNGV